MTVRKVFPPIFFILIVLITVFEPFVATSEEISDKVFRLHILANSNSTYDQDVKLKLKNFVLTETSDLFCAQTLDENIEIAKENVDYINDLCNGFLDDIGYFERCTVSVDREYFKTRVYDDFTLPAGIYNCLKIVIGKGEGHNWWCILFPSVCLSACSSSMYDYLDDDEIELIESDYTPKFKLIEIYEKVKYKMNY